MLGTNATVQLEMTDGSSQRFFNGYVTRFVRPKLSMCGITDKPMPGRD